jgi:hypothetical protein
MFLISVKRIVIAAINKVRLCKCIAESALAWTDASFELYYIRTPVRCTADVMIDPIAIAGLRDPRLDRRLHQADC